MLSPEMMDPNAFEILTGRFEGGQIPNLQPRVVRIFLASAGADSVTERNIILERVYPELREYCRHRHGVEFQMIDLDWGVSPDEPVDDHTLPDFKLRELERCQKISGGPTFVALIGQRYGERPLYSSIPADEFDVLRMALHNHKGRETRNAPLLDKWYTRDDNSIASIYVLNNIADVIPEYAENDDQKRNQGRIRWLETRREMRRLLQKGAEYCYLEGLIPKEIRDKYVMSEMDCHLLAGVEESEDPENKCIIIFRSIVDLKNYVDDPKASRFAEIIYNEKYEQFEMENESSQLLNLMKERAIQSTSGKNILSYDVLWRYDEVISPQLHKEYLEKMSSDLIGQMKNMIDQSVPKTVYDFRSEIVQETLQHWLHCKDIARTFSGRESEFREIADYLKGTFNQPLVVFGPPGASKTTLMSKVAKESQEILAGEVITVIRYIGFTPRSSDLKQLLASICSQILSSLERNLDDLPHDFKELQKFFLVLLKSIPQHIQLVLIFDSVDTILPDHSAHFMSWLPNLLNRNVKIVASTHPERNKILQRLKQEIIRNDEALLEMKPLADDDGEIMLNFFLGLYGRKITPEQMQVFKDAMQRCSLPMYVSMCAEHAKNLRSTDNIELSSLPTTIHEGINHMFDKLERKHGCILISKSMAYMVASVTGLSDCEMEDLLSLDEDVMNNVFRDYHPPVRRLPCLNWLRLKDDIRTFLIQREADGVTVCCFRQEEFNEVIRKRYLCDSDTTKEIHSMIADYFLGTWHGKAKPIKRVNCGNRVSLVPMGSEAYRQVPSQPLTFQFEGGSVKFNRRKYDQVPRHLYLAERLKELNNLVLFNYEWMYNKIKALSLQHIMADFALNPGVEAHLVEEALHVAESVIEIDINNLAPEISGHLLPYYSTMPNIRALVHQCDTDGLKHCAVLPNFPYLQVPGSSLICTLDTLVCGEFFKLFQDDRYLLMKQRESSHIHMYDLAVGERKNSIFTSNGDLHITPDGKYFIIVDHVTEKAVKIHNSSTGDFVGQLIVLNHIQLKPKERYKMGDVSVTNDRVCLIVSTDTSYLCIADIEKCAFLQIISLDGRCEICRITPGGKYVFCNSNEFLLAYDLYTLEHTCTFALGHRPNSLAFSKDGFRGYLSSSAESKLLVMHLHRGTVEMAYKTPLEEEMPDDSIMNLRVSPKDDTILVRGLDHILVYSRFNEKVIASFPRPKDIPKEFKLPKSHFINLFFTDAEYTRDGNFVIGTIFRNIYLWHISSGNLVTSIQAPVGIISELLVSSKRSQIVTHIKGATDIQVWNIDEAVNQVNMLDRLTGAITDVQVTGDSSIAYVMCKDSDEIGVIDMKTGGMLDLLTHDSPVSDFAITPSGVYVLVSTHSKKSNMATKLWDLSERKIIKEFGNAAGYCISSHDDSYIIFVSQEELNFKAPYFITVFKFIGDAFHEYTHPLALKYILEKPFLTSDDKFLVALTAQNYVRLTASYDTPTICAFSMEEDMKVSYFTPESFQGTINMKSITDLKPCLRNPYTIAVLYESNNEMDINENATSKSQTDSHSGLVILDICSGSVIAICDPFFTSATSLERGIVYANDFSFCLDAKSNLFDITKGCLRGQLPNPGVQPRLVALNGTAVVYYNENMLYVVRIKDGKQIAKCNVHAKLCHLHLCKNDRTLIAGCADGTIASYVLIDSQNEVANDVIVTLRSRKVGETIDLDGRLSRSWDKIENGGCSPHSRPVSAAIHGPKDKVLLKRIKPAPKIRPNSDTFMYLNSNSKSCSVM